MISLKNKTLHGKSNLKLVFLSYLPLTKTIKDNLHLDELASRGIIFEYWDLSNCFFPKYHFKNKVKNKYIFKFNSLQEFEVEIRKDIYKSIPFLTYISIAWKTIKIFRILTLYKRKIDFFSTGHLPYRKVKKNLFSYILQFSFNDIIGSLLVKFLIRVKYIKNFNTIFCAGELAYDKETNAKKLIKFNHFDYDKFLYSKSSKIIRKKKYAVFVDGNLPYHQDFRLFGKNVINDVQYFNLINNFFDLIENKYDLKIVILSHPKSLYEKKIFNNRDIIIGNSKEYISNAEFVLLHISTAVSYAVIYYKPIILLTSNEIINKMQNPFNEIMKGLSHELGAQMINMNHKIKEIDSKKLKVKKDLYLRYKYKYLTSKEVENKFNVDILSKHYQN